MDTTLIIGTTGATLILLAFIMNQLHYWKGEDLIYDFVNLLGSGLLVVYAIILSSYPFMVLNFVWALVSLRDCVIDIRRS